MRFLLYFFCGLIFVSCKSQSEKCKSQFEEALQIINRNSNSSSQSQSLDSALAILDKTIMCDTVKKVSVELKLRILLTENKYSEALSFVDSLKESDFSFDQKWYHHNAVLALEFYSKNEIVKRDSVVRKEISDLEKYINTHTLTSKEFEAVFIELFDLKQSLSDAAAIKKEVDSLKKIYPEKERFWSFFE